MIARRRRPGLVSALEILDMERHTPHRDQAIRQALDQGATLRDVARRLHTGRARAFIAARRARLQRPPRPPRTYWVE